MARLLLLACLLGGCANPVTARPPDAGAPVDGGTHDLRHVDQAPPRDLAVVADLTLPPQDLSTPADLTPPPDLVTPPDLIDSSVPPDMACDGNACSAACIAQCFVQMKLGIGQCQNGTCVCVCV